MPHIVRMTTQRNRSARRSVPRRASALGLALLAGLVAVPIVTQPGAALAQPAAVTGPGGPRSASPLFGYRGPSALNRAFPDAGRPQTPRQRPISPPALAGPNALDPTFAPPFGVRPPPARLRSRNVSPGVPRVDLDPSDLGTTGAVR